MTLKVGDIVGGWEVTKVEMKPIYTKRRRVKVADDTSYYRCYSIKDKTPPILLLPKVLKGDEGWQYINECHRWVVLDKYPDKIYKFRDVELEII
jgi:hypothetical protein